MSVINIDSASRKSERLGASDCVAIVLAHNDIQVAATSVATALARGYGCEHAGIGMLKGNTMRVLALSGVADTRDELGVMRQLAAAMDEALDQHTSLRFPPAADDPPRITLMHADLANAGLGAALLTIPLAAAQHTVGALLMVRNRAWSNEERDELEELAMSIGPLLALRLRAGESVFAHMRRKLREFGENLRGPGAIGTKLISLLVLLLAAGSLFIPVTENVSADARLEGKIERSVSAPSDSFIKDVFVRPGAKVKAGSLLLTLNDSDLRNEQGKLESELARFRGEQAEAFARQDRARMVIAQSRADEVAAQLALVTEQLSRTRLIAPFDGIVIRGDLQQQAGAPVKRGDVLMVLAPSTDYRLVLQVDERDVGRLRKNQAGKVAFEALPGERFDIRIERITPVASVVDGRNTFEVEARLLQQAEGLRPGLEGVAQIAQGERPLALIGSQRVLDWLNFRLWTLFG